MAEKKSDGFSADERAAMKQRAAELRAEKARAKSADKEAADLAACQDAIAAMGESDRALAEQIHEIVAAAAPHLRAKTWYGMPAYTLDGKVVVFFSPAEKFKARYASIGFEERANLDDGHMWPTGFALLKIGPEERARITELVTRAAS